MNADTKPLRRDIQQELDEMAAKGIVLSDETQREYAEAVRKQEAEAEKERATKRAAAKKKASPRPSAKKAAGTRRKAGAPIRQSSTAKK